MLGSLRGLIQNLVIFLGFVVPCKCLALRKTYGFPDSTEILNRLLKQKKVSQIQKDTSPE